MKQSYLVKIATIILFSLGSMGIVAGSFLFRNTFSRAGETQIITDKSRYREIRTKLWSDIHEIKHFPSGIPADAQGVHLAYSPGLMQASSFFQIRLKQSPEKIQNLLSHYRNISQHQYRGGDTNDHSNQPNGVPTTFFYTSNSANESFPVTYEILVLNAKNRGTPGFKWNHGDSYGVAIDSSASEIVYWAEKW
ncbi:hypothetical protein Cylst_6094 [Cylindrospermum stagnale PCC 7417]|uniref:Uncharacterized protein n=1 Tax=Cylindrospermum stagnale PCC 7417 TaxID=56107 RepID=K9X605_9NOST|nr:hypothetical protein [Cylindrospermum stagnale]AFZ28065.1 hypothetical protein Cylst_6094 [Cylindrospermum stagnale PCC 7417]